MSSRPPPNDTSHLSDHDVELDKSTVAQLEQIHNGNLTPEEAGFLASFSDEQKKIVLRKVDWRLVPMLLVLYLISFIDRANIGNAKIEGLLPDLNMSGTQYNIALAIFCMSCWPSRRTFRWLQMAVETSLILAIILLTFRLLQSYLILWLIEVPSNAILNMFERPSLFMGGIVTAWGLVMTCHGFVHNFQELCGVRILLGLFEAGFFPGAILLISKWYMPHESQTRIAIFFTASAIAGAFSGLLAFAISKMDGVGGYEGWRWIFILEGIASVIAGVACFWLLIDTPKHSHKWLSPDEIRYLELRQVAAGRVKPKGHKEKAFDWRIFRSVLVDWKIYLLILMFWSNVTPNYGLKFTMPQIIKNMGYTSANAQLLTIPCYTTGAIAAYGFSVISDRFKWRMPTIVVPQLCVVVAYSILCAKADDIRNNIPACYFAICLACFGLYPIGPGVQAWNMNNLAGPAKRAMGIGWMTGVGNMGGITGSFIFIEKEAPKYPTGFGASLGFAAAGVLAALLLEFLLWSINKKNEKLTEADIHSQFSEEELDKMGDKSPLFKYTL